MTGSYLEETKSGAVLREDIEKARQVWEQLEGKWTERRLLLEDAQVKIDGMPQFLYWWQLPEEIKNKLTERMARLREYREEMKRLEKMPIEQAAREVRGLIRSRRRTPFKMIKDIADKHSVDFDDLLNYILKEKEAVIGDKWLVPTEIPMIKAEMSGGRTMDEIRARQIAEEAAVKAVELQGSRIAERVAKELSSEAYHQSPVSAHCEAVLETPPSCWDFRGIRSYVLCKAWQIMEEERRARLPVGEAWAEARRVCKRE